MAERSEGPRDQNELTHPSRREVIRVLGGSALLGPFIWSGCFSRDPLSPDDDSGPPLRLNTQAALVNPNQPLILWVPGFTGKPFLGINGLELLYYASQKRNLDERDQFDMNGYEGFESDHAAIQCNADAIAAFLRDKKAQNDGQRVTMISHSKGGQDVLHALVELDNEKDLPYANRKTEWTDDDGHGGQPINSDLWDSLAGWVAFTSNWFESEFPIEGDNCTAEIDDKHECGVGEDCFDEPKKQCPPDTARSAYGHLFTQGDYSFVRNVPEREQYMYDHRHALQSLMACVPTVTVVGSYIPPTKALTLKNRGSLDKFNRGIRENGGGANDGLVPQSAGILPGAVLKRLASDPDKKNHCGADHTAPAFNVPNRAHRFWTNGFRNQATRNYIRDVESASSACEPPPTIEVEIDIKPGGTPNSINCNNPNGVIPVAILSTDTFDATTVDHTTVTFEGASETHVDKRTGLARRHEEDVNGDGRTDLVFHFRLRDADLGCGSTEARLEGETFDGQRIFGVDSVRMIDAGNGNRGANGDEGRNGQGNDGNSNKGNKGNSGNENSGDKGNKGGNGKGKGKGQDQ